MHQQLFGSRRHVTGPKGRVSPPATRPVVIVSGSPSLPNETSSTRQHTALHTRARSHKRQLDIAEQGSLMAILCLPQLSNDGGVIADGRTMVPSSPDPPFAVNRTTQLGRRAASP